jgi:hypothetical protein
MRRERERREANARRIFLIAAAVVMVVIVGGLVAAWHYYMSSTRDVTVTVTDKNRVCSGASSGTTCQYLIFTSGGTFKDTDSLVAGKFASSDLYGQIQTGQTYTFHVRGYRIPILSEYPNILSIDKVGK